MNIALLASLAFQLSWAVQSKVQWHNGSAAHQRHVIMQRPRQTRVTAGHRLFWCDSVDTFSRNNDGGP